MSGPAQLKIDPALGLSIEVIPASPHVFRYKMWVKPGGAGQWTFLGKGTTVDAAPDRLELGKVSSGTRLQYWLGVGGKAGVPYAAEFRVEQGGNLVPNGKWDEADTMDGKAVTATVWIVEFI
jgi:hypothetical protein